MYNLFARQLSQKLFLGRLRGGDVRKYQFIGIASIFAVFGTAGFAAQSGDSKEQPSVVSQDITIHGKSSESAGLAPPPAISGKPVAGEVIHSLRLYKADYKVSSTLVRIPDAIRRLSRPFPPPPYLSFHPKAFPRPYARWAFEVMADGVVVWKTQGNAKLGGDASEDGEDAVRIGGRRKNPEVKLGWDGSDTYGAFIARVGPQYSFRFTGYQGEGEYAVTSEPVTFTSVAVPEGSSGIRLEVSTAMIFPAGETEFSEGAKPYLQDIAERLRRVNFKGERCRFSLYQKDPQSKLSRERAQNLVDYFSGALLVNPSKVIVELLPPKNRGEVMTCVIPIASDGK